MGSLHGVVLLMLLAVVLIAPTQFAAAQSAPSITSAAVTAATEDALYSYTVTATDPDVGDTQSFSLDVAPAGMTIDATTGEISWTPDNSQVGNNDVTVRVTDSDGLSDAQSFTISVANTNDAPITTGIGPITVNEDATLTVLDLTSFFTDIEDGAAGLTYSVESNTNPALVDATIASPLTLTYTPGASGSADITIRATDSGGLFVESTFTITVNPVNDNPTANAGTDQSVGEQTTVTLSGSGADADGDTLSFSWSQTGGTPVTLSGATTASPTFTSPVVADGATDVLTFELTVDDGNGGTATDSVVITANPVNEHPTVTVVEELTAIKEDIINGVSGVEDPKHAVKAIDKAIDHLLKSLDPTQDEDHSVFNDHRHVIKDILHAIDKGEISNTAIITQLLNVVDKIITSDRLLAQQAIDNAKITPDADLKKIEKAEERLAQGDQLLADAQATTDLDKINKLIKTIDRLYGQAWKSATNAVGQEDNKDDAIANLDDRLEMLQDEQNPENINLGDEVSEAAQLLQLLSSANKEEHDDFMDLFHEYKDKLKEMTDVGQGNSQGSLEQKLMFGELDKLELKLRMQSLKVGEEDFKKDQIKEATEMSNKQKGLDEIHQQMTLVMVGKDWQERDKKLAELQEQETNMLRSIIMIEKAQNGEELTPEVLKNIDEEINEKVDRHQGSSNDENNNGHEGHGKNKDKSGGNDNANGGGNDNDNNNANGGGNDNNNANGGGNDNDNNNANGGCNGNGNDNSKDEDHGKNKDKSGGSDNDREGGN